MEIPAYRQKVRCDSKTSRLEPAPVAAKARIFCEARNKRMDGSRQKKRMIAPNNVFAITPAINRDLSPNKLPSITIDKNICPTVVNNIIPEPNEPEDCEKQLPATNRTHGRFQIAIAIRNGGTRIRIGRCLIGGLVWIFIQRIQRHVLSLLEIFRYFSLTTTNKAITVRQTYSQQLDQTKTLYLARIVSKPLFGS